MPLYEYECQACGHHLEAQQRMADAALVTCPSCGKDQLQKLISASAFHLKGGGWYKDLYASAKPGESKSTDAGKSSDAGKTATPASTETKSEPAKTSTDSSSTSAAPAASPKPSSSTPAKSGSGT